MRFITNFKKDQTAIYLEAIKRSGETSLSIKDEARIPDREDKWDRDRYGRRDDYPFTTTNPVLEGYRSLWDSKGYRELGPFWRIFDQVKIEMTTVTP